MFDGNGEYNRIKKRNSLKTNDGLSNVYYSLGEEGNSEDELALAIRNMNHIYKRGKIFSRWNQTTSLYTPKCYECKNTDHLTANCPKLKEKGTKETKKNKKDFKGKKGKGLAGTWDEENRSNEEGSANEWPNIRFIGMGNNVFYTPSNILSCDDFLDDPRKILSSMYEKINKISIKT